MAIKIGTQVDLGPLKALEKTLGGTAVNLEKFATAQKKAANGDKEAAKEVAKYAKAIGMSQQELAKYVVSVEKVKSATESLARVQSPFSTLAGDLPRLKSDLREVRKLIRETAAERQKLWTAQPMALGELQNTKAATGLISQADKELEKQAALRAAIAQVDPSKVRNKALKEEIVNLQAAQKETARLKKNYEDISGITLKKKEESKAAAEAEKVAAATKKAELAAKRMAAAFASVKAPFSQMSSGVGKLSADIRLVNAEMLRTAQLSQANLSNKTYMGMTQNIKGAISAEQQLNAEIEKQGALKLRLAQLDPNTTTNKNLLAQIDNLKLATAETNRLKKAVKELEAAQSTTKVAKPTKTELNAAAIKAVQQSFTTADASVGKFVTSVRRANEELLKTSVLNAKKLGNKTWVGSYQNTNASISLQKQLNSELAKQADIKAKLAMADKNYGTKVMKSDAANLTTARQETAKLEKQLKSMDAQSKTSSKAMTGWGNNMKYALGGVARSLGAMTYSYSALAPLLAGIAFGTAVKKVFELGTAFEYTTKYITALQDGLDGVSAKGLQKAITGIDSRKGASEIAAGMKELAKAGVDAETSLKEIPELIKFATLAEIELGEATKLVVGQSKAFGTTFSESANKIAAAALSSATDIQELATALSYTTELATVSGTSFTEVATSLAIMANAGIRGSKAGTAIRTSLLKMQAPSSKLKGKLDKLGISWSAFTEGGQVKNLRTMFTELKRVTDALPPAERVGILKDLFGLRALKGGANLLRSMGDEYDRMYEKVLIAGEGTTFLAEKYMELEDTGKASLDRLGASWEKFLLQTADTAHTDQMVRNITGSLKDLLDSGVLDSLASGTVGVIGGFVEEFAGGLGSLGDTYELLVKIDERLNSIEEKKKAAALEPATVGDIGTKDYLKMFTGVSFADKLGIASTIGQKFLEKTDKESPLSTFEQQFAASNEKLQKEYDKFSRLVSAHGKEIDSMKEKGMDFSTEYLREELASLNLELSKSKIMGEGYEGTTSELENRIKDFESQIAKAASEGATAEFVLELQVKEILEADPEERSWALDSWALRRMEALQSQLDEIAKKKALQLRADGGDKDAQMTIALAQLNDEELAKFQDKMADYNFSAATSGMDDVSKLTANAAEEARKFAESLGVAAGTPIARELEAAAVAAAAMAKITNGMEATKKRAMSPVEAIDYDIDALNDAKLAAEKANASLTTEERTKNELNMLELNKAFTAKGLELAKKRAQTVTKIDTDKTNIMIDNAKRLNTIAVDRGVAYGNISQADANLKKLGITLDALAQKKDALEKKTTFGMTDANREKHKQGIVDLGLKYQETSNRLIAANAAAAESLKKLQQEFVQLSLAASGSMVDNHTANIAATTASWQSKIDAETPGSGTQDQMRANMNQEIANMNSEYNKTATYELIELEARHLDAQGKMKEASLLRLNATYLAEQETYAGSAELMQKSTDVFLAEQDRIKNGAESNSEAIQSAMAGWASGFAGDLTDIMWGADTTFASILDGFLKMIAEMVIQMGIVKPLMEGMFGVAGGGGGWASGFTSFIGGLFADGGVPGGKGLSNYKNSVVSSPTVFPFAKGVGLMGEAGPEAIMPLTRTSGGELGVRMTNDGGSAGGAAQQEAAQPNIRIINSLDPSVMNDYLGSDAGEKVILNVMSKNRNLFAGAM